MQKRVNDFWREKEGGYIMQGDYLALHMEEQSCLTWMSYIWDIPQGVLKFAINVGINTLPSADNLKMWGKRVSDRCGFVVTSKPWRTFSQIVRLPWIKDVLRGATTQFSRRLSLSLSQSVALDWRYFLTCVGFNPLMVVLFHLIFL